MYIIQLNEAVAMDLIRGYDHVSILEEDNNTYYLNRRRLPFDGEYNLEIQTCNDDGSISMKEYRCEITGMARDDEIKLNYYKSKDDIYNMKGEL